MKLALGTVQFGLNYGIANRNGQVKPSEIAVILQAARSAGIDTIDTAIAYGDSEARLGVEDLSGFRVISKLPPLNGDATAIPAMVDASLQRLGIPSLAGLLLHRSSDLSDPAGRQVHDALAELKARGKIGKIGVSIYDPAELEPIFDQYAIEIVQAPFNVFDRRLAESGWLDRLSAASIEVHTRSAFLQGLLLMDAKDRPAKFARWQGPLTAWHGWLAKSQQTPVNAALGFACGDSRINRVVVGVDSPLQLAEVVTASRLGPANVPKFILEDAPTLINPANWPNL